MRKWISDALKELYAIQAVAAFSVTVAKAMRLFHVYRYKYRTARE